MATLRLSSRGSTRYFNCSISPVCVLLCELLFTHATSTTAWEEGKELIQLYYQQVTQGCGHDDCENDVCASNKRFKRQLSNDEAAAEAILLLKKQSKLYVSNYKKKTVALRR